MCKELKNITITQQFHSKGFGSLHEARYKDKVFFFRLAPDDKLYHYEGSKEIFMDLDIVKICTVDDPFNDVYYLDTSTNKFSRTVYSLIKHIIKAYIYIIRARRKMKNLTRILKMASTNKSRSKPLKQYQCSKCGRMSLSRECRVCNE